MKTAIIKQFSWVFMILMLMTACDEDGDKIYLSGIEGSDFIATSNKVILSKENAKQVVLSLAWTKAQLVVSNPDMAAPKVLTSFVEISTNINFTSNVIETLELGLSKAYTGAELNTIAKTLALEPNKATNVYFRLRSATGNNIPPAYSKTIAIETTSYLIDMSKAFILDKEMTETGNVLLSASSNGIYTGFVGAAAWSNFYLQEGDGTTWGNDALDESPFIISSQDDSDKRWNFWFPGLSGCYLTEVNTVKKQWLAQYISALTVSGDLKGTMTFDRPNMKWNMTFNATSASTLKIKVQASTKLYDYTTGTDDTKAKDAAIAFAQNGESLILSAQAGEITVDVAQAGEYTLEVDLSNQTAWKCLAVKGSSEPIVVNPLVYVAGIDDGLTGGAWNFNNSLKLYNEDNLAYAGVVNVNSLWGYAIHTEKDNWSDFYKMATGDAASGTLVAKGQTNIPAPTAGLYLIDVSLNSLTYKTTNIANSIYVLGLNDAWLFNTPLNLTTTAGVYKGTITISKASEWGFVIHLVNNNWDVKLGGSGGKLYYLGSNIKDDASLAAGTYQMTVDLINGTYSITQ